VTPVARSCAARQVSANRPGLVLVCEGSR
jgi:hypothetical protein